MTRVVLVIDDDAAMRITLGQVLSRAGHEVILAADGNEGLQLCRTKVVDLVLTDLFMPNKEGMETIMELRREFSKVAIIAMSGMPDVAPMLSTARLLGAGKTLEKPFESEELLGAIEELLQK
jgi:DNA-binding response OmpR family regulator